MKITVFPISIPDCGRLFRRCWDTFWIKDHSRNTVSYQLKIQAFESLEGFKMYYVIGASVSSLHSGSTDSLIV